MSMRTTLLLIALLVAAGIALIVYMPPGCPGAPAWRIGGALFAGCP